MVLERLKITGRGKPPPQRPTPSGIIVEGHVYHGHFVNTDRMAFMPFNAETFNPNDPTGYLPENPLISHRRGVYKAEVIIWGPYGSWNTTTDEEGHYVLEGIPPGTYHMLARRGARPDTERNLMGRGIIENLGRHGHANSHLWIHGGAPGGYLPHYIDQVVVPPPTTRRSSIKVDFELTPLEGPMRHKISYKGGTSATRNTVRDISQTYHNIGLDRDQLSHRLHNVVSGLISPQERTQIEHLMNTDYNEAIRRMIHAEAHQLEQHDHSFRLADVRFHQPFVQGSVLSSFTEGTIRKMGSSAGMLLAGLAISAMTGSFLFTAAFFCWILSVLLPVPSQYAHIKREIDRLNSRYDAIEKSLAPSHATQQEVTILEERRRTDAMILLSTLEEMNMGHAGVSAGLKFAFRIVGLALFSFAFLYSNIPLAKPLGVLAAIIAYFMIRYQKSPDQTVYDRADERGLGRRPLQWPIRRRNRSFQNP